MMCTFSDVMNFISWKHASPTFTNFALDAAKFNKYTFYHAIMENAAMVTKGHVELVREATGNAPRRGGVRGRGKQGRHLVPDRGGCARRAGEGAGREKEATALGAAILAEDCGVGLYKDIAETARRLVQWEHVYQPNWANHQVYQEMYAPWREVYQAQLALSDRGLTRYMWVAPGL